MLTEGIRRAQLLRQLPRPQERRRLRRAARLSLAVVAGEIGVTAPAVLHWERGQRTPRDLAVLERYLGVLRLLAASQEK